MAVILRYFAEFGRFGAVLRKSGQRYTYTFCEWNVAQRYITYGDIPRESPPAGALKWSNPLSLANIWQLISHNLETVQDRR